MTNMWKTTIKTSDNVVRPLLSMSCKLRVNKLSGIPSGLQVLRFDEFSTNQNEYTKKFLLLTNYHIDRIMENTFILNNANLLRIYIPNFVIKYPAVKKTAFVKSSLRLS
jgi:hypothetical protein